MSVQPLYASEFHGRIRRAQLYEIRAVDITSEAATVQHGTAHVAQTRRAQFNLDLQLHGTSRFTHAGREAALTVGDFVLTDSTRTYKVAFELTNSMRMFCIPADLLRRYVGSPADIAGIKIDGNVGSGRLVSTFLRSLWTRPYEGATYGGVGYLERAILELIGSAYARICRTQSGMSSLAAVHRMQVIDKIEVRLTDCKLTPQTLANELRMSTRNLHRVFAISDETVGAYILRRRLERCARQLTNAAHGRQNISDIAYSCGFSAFSHFCRTFREHYGVTPGEFRLHAI